MKTLVVFLASKSLPLSSRNLLTADQPLIWTRQAPLWARALGAKTQPISGFPLGPEPLSLGELVAGTRILPCLTAPVTLPHRFVLRDDAGRSCALSVFDQPELPAEASSERISSHLDWFEIHGDIKNARLELWLDASELPADAILCVSRRGPGQPAQDAPPATDHILDIPSISQMEYRPKRVRRRVCSPVCVAMVMAYFQRQPKLKAFIKASYHPSSGLYGVWPLNMQAAARQGFLASACYLPSLATLARLIDAETPVPVSIRFAPGELPGSPLPSTPGHLLTLRGMRDGMAHLSDPAALSKAEVNRAYDLDAFARAWHNHHRIGYLLSPSDRSPNP